MKKIYTVFIFPLLIVLQVHSQDRFMRSAAEGGHETGPNQIRIGYGIITMPRSLELTGNGSSAKMVPGTYKDITLSGTGAMSMSYTRDNYALIVWGGDLVYENLKSNYTYSDGSSFTLNTSYVSAILRADLRYINGEKFQLYSSVGAGVSMAHTSYAGQSRNDWLPALHITGLGFRYGNNVAFFGELGYGYRGVANGGISFRF